MSSTHLDPTKPVGSRVAGTSSSKYILSDDPKLNPDFFHAHKVFVVYCSSDIHSGQQTEASPETFNLYFSGHLNLVHIFDALKTTHPDAFGNAARVLFAGSSAGGDGTFRNIDWARDYFPSNTVVRGAPVGGWFVPGDAPDQPNTYDPPSRWPDWSVGKATQWPEDAPDPWNSFLSPPCVKALKSNASRCASAHVSYPYITVPLYVTESNYDTNQLDAQLGFNEKKTSALAQEYVRYFGRAMRNSTAQVNKKPNDALFLASCWTHTEGLGLGYGIRVDNRSSGVLLGDWFYDRLAPSDRILVDHCPGGGELPCNPTCEQWPSQA